MRRAFAVALLLLATAPAAAQEPPEYNARCGEFACRLERVPAQWYLDGVDRDLRTLRLVYVSGGCRRGDGRALVVETSSGIGITVDESTVVAIDTPDHQVVCTDDLRYRTLQVRLARRVDGRRIRGRERVDEPLRKPSLTPGVLDLAAVDATAVLRLHGFAVRRILHRSGTVAFQSPLPDTRTRRRTASLTLGRDAFDARALASCLRAPELQIVRRRPRPGDENAPDLELRVLTPTWPVFVALYADPARADDNAPDVRRNARRVGGSVERPARRVTIVWTRPPAAALRAHVVGCVADARP